MEEEESFICKNLEEKELNLKINQLEKNFARMEKEFKRKIFLLKEVTQIQNGRFIKLTKDVFDLSNENTSQKQEVSKILQKIATQQSAHANDRSKKAIRKSGDKQEKKSFNGSPIRRTVIRTERNLLKKSNEVIRKKDELEKSGKKVDKLQLLKKWSCEGKDLVKNDENKRGMHKVIGKKSFQENIHIFK